MTVNALTTSATSARKRRRPRETLLVVALTALAAAEPTPVPTAEPAPPATPREFYNTGTQKLREHKLREAEAFLESALASQIDGLQPPALYNLGHVRFGQGVEELKKGPAAGPTASRGRQAAKAADEAIQAAGAALADNDVQKMVAAYMHGRGVRKELRAATKAVQQALGTHRAALGRWQRAEGDFKSTVELARSDADAEANADTVDRCIAKLVDSLRDLQQAAMAMGDKNLELGEKMKQLKGRIPAEDAPPGGAGDDDEEEDQPQGPEPGQKDGHTKEGEEMTISPEQAGWLLEGFKLDNERRLPMGGTEPAEPRDHNRPTW